MATSRYVKDAHLNDFIKSLVAQGWAIEHSKHLKLRAPNGRLVSCSYTPSCPFVVKKVKADVKRALRK